jgi:YegS/Rv2252/BmrU family lipid kinase
MPSVALIINPTSGPAATRRTPDECEAIARRALAAAGPDPWIAFTQGPGHARELTRRAIEAGAALVLAWGGDGTVNEVASTLLETGGTLGIVPVGSGNGLARDLRMPRQPALALTAAVTGSDRWIDAGAINGRVFFNVAGIGFDARVAHVFAHRAARTRGLASYVSVTCTELFGYQAAPCHIVADGVDLGVRHPLLVSVANTCQWGNGAQIAPCARPDDGVLDLVIVDARHAIRVLAQSWRLFTGAIAGMPGVTLHTVRAVTLTADVDLPLHADGEPMPPARSVDVHIRPHALRVRVPQEPGR